jgi:hypothetical protein
MSCFRLKRSTNLVFASDFSFRSLLKGLILMPYWACGRITRPQALFGMSHETNHEPNMVAYFVYRGIFMMNVGSVRCACHCDTHFFSERRIHYDEEKYVALRHWHVSVRILD